MNYYRDNIMTMSCMKIVALLYTHTRAHMYIYIYKRSTTHNLISSPMFDISYVSISSLVASFVAMFVLLLRCWYGNLPRAFSHFRPSISHHIWQIRPDVALSLLYAFIDGTVRRIAIQCNYTHFIITGYKKWPFCTNDVLYSTGTFNAELIFITKKNGWTSYL